MKRYFLVVLLALTFFFSFNAYVEARDSIADNADFIDIFQQEFGTTQANDDYPILKTIGAATCIAVVLFDPTSQVGSMAHIATFDNGWLREMLLSMRRAGYKDDNKASVEVYVVGGYEGMSDDLFQSIKKSLFSFGFSQIAEIDYGDIETESIALDTRNGVVYDLTNIIPYTPPKNENERLREKLREVRALLPDVHYTDDEKAKKYEVISLF